MRQEPRLQIEVDRSDDQLLVLRPTGELSLDSADLLRAAIAQRPASGALVIDLHDLAFIDTTGLRLLLDTRRESEDAGWPFALIAGRPTLHRTFEVAGLVMVLRFVDEPDDVL